MPKRGDFENWDLVYDRKPYNNWGGELIYVG